MANPFVRRSLTEASLEQPIDVYLGEQSLDEMCFLSFALVFWSSSLAPL